MANDTYTANADGSCYVGMFSGITGIAQGGTVSALAADVAASGFTLLTTAPAGNDTYRNAGHAGMAWDEDRKAAWIFGAETHSIEAQYDNSVYCFDTSDGLFKKMYNQSPWLGEYNIDADGYLWADDAGTLPWACHTYQRLHYDAATKELVVPYDTEFHAYTTPIQKGGIALANRKKPIWRYNTLTKQWRTVHSGGTQSFLSGGEVQGAAYSPVWGWVSTDNVALLRLSNDGVYTSTSLSGKINSRIHDSAFFIGDNFVKFAAGIIENGVIMSVHPMGDLASSYTVLKESYPALSGWQIVNKPATPMTDGRILFIAQDDFNNIGAFIYSFTDNTITDTGHRLTGATGTYSTYNFKIAWSASLNAAIVPLEAMGSPLKVYLLRL